MPGHSYEVFWQLMFAVLVESTLVAGVCLTLFYALMFGLRRLNAQMVVRRWNRETPRVWEAVEEPVGAQISNAA